MSHKRTQAAWDRIEVWSHMTLPDATELLARLAPFGIGVAALMAGGNAAAALRRSDTGTVIGASIAWLFAFAWVLACLYVWRTPHMLIGGTVSG